MVSSLDIFCLWVYTGLQGLYSRFLSGIVGFYRVVLGFTVLVFLAVRNNYYKL